MSQKVKCTLGVFSEQSIWETLYKTNIESASHFLRAWEFLIGHFLLEFFMSYLHMRDQNTYYRTYFSHFWNMSFYDNSRVIRVLLRQHTLSENQNFLDEGKMIMSLFIWSMEG